MSCKNPNINDRSSGSPLGKTSVAIFLAGMMILVSQVGLTGAALAKRNQTGTNDICDRAAVLASNESRVPLSVLRAITRAETGRSKNGALHPWPWTVNMQGKGVWFETEDEARAYVFRHYKSGARSFDLGCFQINYKWHGASFASIDDMFDPVQNARYAAQFLSELHTEFGDWSKAAGAYHSRTAIFANKYIARFDRIHSNLDGKPYKADMLVQGGGSKTPEQRNPKDGPAAIPLPLLAPGGVARLGSLVPLSRRDKDRAFFGPKTGGI
jgi:Transglycosylase SLT domain